MPLKDTSSFSEQKISFLLTFKFNITSFDVHENNFKQIHSYYCIIFFVLQMKKVCDVVDTIVVTSGDAGYDSTHSYL